MLLLTRGSLEGKERRHIHDTTNRAKNSSHGEPHLLWHAVDEHGAELDILLQQKRSQTFFKRVLRSSPVPRKIVTDQLRSYPAEKAEIPELANVKHVFVKAAARLSNRTGNS